MLALLEFKLVYREEAIPDITCTSFLAKNDLVLEARLSRMTEQELATDLLSELESLKSAHLLVLGDLILDRYTWGNAERISQEAPVVVLRADQRESRLGGAANVACMLRGLEARVTCVGLTGSDEAGDELRGLLHADGIDDELVISDPARQTTVRSGRT